MYRISENSTHPNFSVTCSCSRHIRILISEHPPKHTRKHTNVSESTKPKRQRAHVESTNPEGRYFCGGGIQGSALRRAVVQRYFRGVSFVRVLAAAAAGAVPRSAVRCSARHGSSWLCSVSALRLGALEGEDTSIFCGVCGVARETERRCGECTCVALCGLYLDIRLLGSLVLGLLGCDVHCVVGSCVRKMECSVHLIRWFMGLKQCEVVCGA